MPHFYTGERKIASSSCLAALVFAAAFAFGEEETLEAGTGEAAETVETVEAAETEDAVAEGAVDLLSDETATDAAATNAVQAAASGETQSADSAADKEPPEMDTRLFHLNHCAAAEVAAKFNEMWCGGFGDGGLKVAKMAVAFPESNTVLATAPKPVLDACEKAIEALDVEADQIYIEARFVELSSNASRKIGIDWQALDSLGMTAKATASVQKSKIGRGVNDYERTVTDGKTSTSYGISGGRSSNGEISYFNGTLDVSEMSIILHALEASDDAKTFSNPKIIVSSGKKAIVDMTQKYPNVKIAAKRTTSGGSDSLDLDMQMAAIPGENKFMFAKEAFFSWGIELEVTPRVASNGLINVSIVPTISDCKEYVMAGTLADLSSDTGSYTAKYPIINVQRLVTEFNLASETTAVIGGLSRTIEKQAESGIPLLRDIPYIGKRLFGSKSIVKEQREIVVFVTVGLVDPKEMKRDAGLPKNAILGREYVNRDELEPGDRARGWMQPSNFR